MDLLGWIAADLAGVRQRMTAGVVERVPAHRWAERADGGGSSINHLLLHTARHHDLAVHVAVRNRQPLFDKHRDALGLGDAGPMAGIPEREDRALTRDLPPAALLAYVMAVFDSTARWLSTTGTLALDTVPPTSPRLARHAAIAADEAAWLHSMWSGQAVWWLLQWPVLGHGHTHVGEMTAVRNRMGLSPF